MPAPSLDDGRLMFAFAHDLRTCLRTVLTRIQLVQAGDMTSLPEPSRRFLSEAEKAAAEMNGLLSAMVSYCDASAPGDTVSLALLLRGTLLEMKDTVREADAAVSVVNETDAEVPGNLRPVLIELLTNACRFRRHDVALAIQIAVRRPAQDSLQITVSDNGQGVSKDALERIFQPFCRMNSRDEYPGFGLGLARCRKIIDACGGSIVAEAPPSGGLLVRLSFPPLN